MYTVNETTYTSYFAATAAAEEENANVIQTDNGLVRYTPSVKVTAKQERVYKERLSAYSAYKSLKA